MTESQVLIHEGLEGSYTRDTLPEHIRLPA